MSNQSLTNAMIVVVVMQGLWVVVFISEISELRKKIRVLQKALALQNGKYRDSREIRKALSFNLSKQADHARTN